MGFIGNLWKRFSSRFFRNRQFCQDEIKKAGILLDNNYLLMGKEPSSWIFLFIYKYFCVDSELFLSSSFLAYVLVFTPEGIYFAKDRKSLEFVKHEIDGITEFQFGPLLTDFFIAWEYQGKKYRFSCSIVGILGKNLKHLKENNFYNLGGQKK